jgi:hypothetical protein
MSDRLALSNAIEDAGIERAKAERIASTIVDLIHDNVATKADVATVSANLRQTEIALKADISDLRGEIRRVETSLRGDLALVEHRLLTRLGGLVVVVGGAVVAALHYWPPGHIGG